MKEKELHIGQGKVEVLLIWDPSLGDYSTPFYQWLENEGFRFSGYQGNLAVFPADMIGAGKEGVCFAGYNGYYGCDWVYVNITRKEFAYGMPRVALAKTFGNHAITLDEFYTIYEIFKKYEGKNPLSFE